MPLRVRLGLVFALGTAVVIGAVGLLFLLQLRASLQATIDVGLRARAETVSEQITSEGVEALRLTQDDQPVQVLTPGRRPGLVAGSRSRGRPRSGTTSGRRGVVACGAGPDDVHHGQRGRAHPVRGHGSPALRSPPRGRRRHRDLRLRARERREGFLLLGPPSVLVAGLGAWWLAGEALRPVERMRRQTAEISDRDDDGHLAVPRTRDELAALAVTMNDLLDRLRTALAHERSFVADAGHEPAPRWRRCAPSWNWPLVPGATATSCIRPWSRRAARPTG